MSEEMYREIIHLIGLQEGTSPDSKLARLHNKSVKELVEELVKILPPRIIEVPAPSPVVKVPRKGRKNR